MTFKDNFSAQAQEYARYRPEYPEELYAYLINLVEEKETAWDCATGNGQVAKELAKYFKKVLATDASEAQIRHAFSNERILYTVAPAEKTHIPNKSIDLITVGQAIHWFKFEDFYAEVLRVAKKNAVLALFGYGLMRVSEEVDAIIGYLYFETLGDKFWDAERKHLDNAYQTIPFPFEIIHSPPFVIQLNWNLSDLIGYLHTWSSVQKFIKTNGFSPLVEVEEKLANVWGNPMNIYPITWDLHLKVARL